jgi:glucose dehydrogenase
MLHLRLAACFVAACALLAAADWPQWRGPERNGVSRETGLLQSWPAAGPKLLWKTQGLGEGYSSFAVAAGKLFTLGQKDGQPFAMAFDAASGKPLWRTPAGKYYSNDRGSGPRGVPTIDGKRLYAINGDGALVCLDTDTGKLVWEISMVGRYRGRVPHWGYSESPLVLGDKVIVTPGGPGAAIVALDKNTGAEIWKSQSDPAGYSSPMPFEMGGNQYVVVFTGSGVVGLSAKNGELLWRYDRVSNRVANIATPLVLKDRIFVSSDYGTGCALLKLSAAGGSVKAEEVYFNRDMKNHYTTSVLVGGHLYGFSSTILTAMNAATGEVAWRDRSVGKGNCIYADQRLYCVGENGIVGLIEPSPEKYKEVSRFTIAKGDLPMWTPPVVANGRLYLRDQDTLYSYDVRRGK